MIRKACNIPFAKYIDDYTIEFKLIGFYRFFSLTLTSIVYISINHDQALKYKLILVVCMSIAALILNYLYTKYKNTNSVIKLLIGIEIISNVVILVPTGGLNSPYIWYSLNTIIVVSYYLDFIYFLVNLIFYTLGSTAISYLSFKKFNYGFSSYISDRYNLFLSYLLIIIAIRLLIDFTKKLNSESEKIRIVNNELKEANEMIQSTMGEITYLYQSIYDLINIKNKFKLVKMITKYIKDITRTSLSFCMMKDEYDELVFEVLGELPINIKECLLDDVKKIYLEGGELGSRYIKYTNPDITLIVTPIKSYYMTYGILGALQVSDRNFIEEQNTNQLKYIASLCAILIEKYNMEETGKCLIIAEEQNRIANEIHDSVSQRLFFIQCKIRTLILDIDGSLSNQLKNDLILVKNSLNKATKELRATIYSYSNKKNEGNMFEERIENYINEISKLNNIEITLDINGEQELIAYDLKKIVYRILYEGIGNSIKHSKSKLINVNIDILVNCIKLRIQDNGIGFDLNNKLDGKNSGLGIRNLYNLVYSLNGNIVISSNSKNGTVIKIDIPNNTLKQGDIV